MLELLYLVTFVWAGIATVGIRKALAKHNELLHMLACILRSRGVSQAQWQKWCDEYFNQAEAGK